LRWKEQRRATVIADRPSGPRDHLLGDGTTEGGARDNVAAVVDAGPDAGFSSFLGEHGRRRGVARKEMAEDHRLGRGEAAMRGRITRMVRSREQRLDLRVELERRIAQQAYLLSQQVTPASVTAMSCNA
jgi:hypothetical protein